MQEPPLQRSTDRKSSSRRSRNRRSLIRRTCDRIQSSASRDDIQVELTHLLFRRLGFSVLLGGAGVIGAATLLAHYYTDPLLWLLSILAAVFCSARLAVVIAFSAHPRPTLTPSGAAYWEAAYAFFTFFYCVTIAAFTYYNFHHHDINAQRLSSIGTFSICAALSARIGMRPWISQLCCMIMLGSLALSIADFNTSLARTAVILLCLFAYANWEGASNKFHILIEQLRSKRSLHHLALHDPLTGLANRRHFEETLATLCTQPRTFGILYMDLDRFKQINDTHGHLTGDALLQRVAHRLHEVVRQDDLLARLGGDEFAIIQTQIVDEDSPRHLATRIQQALARPILIDDLELNIRASIGARISEGASTTPRTMIGSADAALYRVKQSGGANFAMAED